MITEESFKQFDTMGMRDLMRSFPDHWNEISLSAKDFNFTIDTSRIKNVCLAGMGGSAIGADIARAYVSKTAPYPVNVIRHYDIPAYIGPETLFIACSYSGNTEETLSALNQALQTGAQIIGITSGGQVSELAEKHGFDCIHIPGGLPPRAALAYSFVPLFRILQFLEIIDEGEEALEETQQFLAGKVSVYDNLEGNQAIDLAHLIKDSLPVIYSDHQLLEAVNIRWRGQLEENSKILVYGNMFPEMNHNEIIGWEHMDHLRDMVSVIFLTDRDDNERVKFRMEVFRELVKDDAKNMTILETEGDSKLCRIFSLVQLVDWISLYLAMLNEEDPTKIEYIDTMKSRLSQFN